VASTILCKPVFIDSPDQFMGTATALPFEKEYERGAGRRLSRRPQP
jgi:hypothetical protein